MRANLRKSPDQKLIKKISYEDFPSLKNIPEIFK